MPPASMGGGVDALRLACPSGSPPPCSLPAQTLFTTRKFSMVFPLAKTTSPVSFTASGRISFTSWAMTPGKGQAKWCVYCRGEATTLEVRAGEGKVLGARDFNSKEP